MIDSINEISKSSSNIFSQIENSNLTLAEIVQIIHDIEGKTKVIDDIVFQTKLLSFNASVEAARAGENGKGFSVVAEEVGNLAVLSGNSSKEITTLLQQSVKKVEEIVENTKKGIDQLASENKLKINDGLEIANRCDAILLEIVNRSNEVSSLSSEVSNATKEQSIGISEINKAMNQIDQITQQNSSASSSVANTAENLAVQSENLKMIVLELKRLMDGTV